MVVTDEGSRFEPGARVSRFVLVERLGSGGMGEVWRASDPALGRDVALKLVPAGAVATPERRRRFESEARAAATVSHPNVAAVHDAGEWEGVPFIVQELVPGETVEEMVGRRGAIPPAQVAEWGGQAAEALAAAHAAGVLHRDVKPANLIVDPSGRLRVVDFGLAKALREDGEGGGERMTREGMVVGTANYMSPEQALGRAVDARSDAFSLGVVLWEMAAGRRAFEGETSLEVMHAVAYDPLPPLREVAPAIPEELASVIERLVRKKPGDRYSRLDEAAAELRRVARSSADVVRPSGPVTPVSGAASGVAPTLPMHALTRALSARTLAVAALVVIGVGGGAWAWFARGRGPVAAREPRAITLTPLESRDEWPAYSPDGKGFVYASNRSGTSHIYYQLLEGGAVVALTSGVEDDRHPAFSPDGGTIFFTRVEPRSGRSSVWSVPVVGGPPRKVLEDGDQPAPSPDGHRVAFVRRTGDRFRLGVVEPGSGVPSFLLDAGPRGEIVSPSFSPDGLWIGFVWRDSFPNGLGDLWKIPAAGGAPLRLTRERRDMWPGVVFLPSGRFVLFTSDRSGISGINMVPSDGGSPPRQVLGGAAFLEKPSLSPDGHSLLVQTMKSSSDAWLFPLDGSAPTPLTTQGTVWAPAFLPDGRFVYGDWARHGTETDLVVADAAGARHVIGEGVNARPSRDGRTLFFSKVDEEGKRVLGTLPVDGGPVRWLTKPLGVDEYPDPTPDGTRIVFCRTRADGSGASGLYALDLETGREEMLLPGDVKVSRAGERGVVFRACRGESCGVWALRWGASEPRLVVPGGDWPALSADGTTVWAWAGPRVRPRLQVAPFDGSAPARELFSFVDASRDRTFSTVFTMSPSPEGKALVVTLQRRQDDIVSFEKVFP